MNALLALTQHDKIGIYIGMFLFILLVIVAGIWLYQEVKGADTDYKKWQKEMDEYFKRKDHEDD